MSHRGEQRGNPASWRRPLLLWPLAWFLTGAGMMLGDVTSEPSRGPLWVALALGCLGWGAAGARSAPGEGAAWQLPLGVAWAAIFASSLPAGIRWARLIEDGGGVGFEGLVAAIGLGGAVGGLLTGIATAGREDRAGRLARGLGAAAVFGVLFLFGAYAGTLASYLLVDAVEAILGGLLGETAALALGFGLGWSVGGLAAGTAEVVVRARPPAAAS